MPDCASGWIPTPPAMIDRRRFLTLAGSGTLAASSLLTGCSNSTLEGPTFKPIDLNGTLVFSSFRGGAGVSTWHASSQTHRGD